MVNHCRRHHSAVFVLWVWSFLGAIHGIQARSSGAPLEACVGLTPSHYGSSPQSELSPYSISVPDFYAPQQSLTVTVSTSGSTALKGILLQVRREGTDEIVGTWSVSDSANFQTSTCGGVSNSAVTHTNSNDKPSTITFTWNAPTALDGVEVYATATFVQSFQMYWVGERSSNIRVQDEEPANDMTSTARSSGDNRTMTTIPTMAEGAGSGTPALTLHTTTGKGETLSSNVLTMIFTSAFYFTMINGR